MKAVCKFMDTIITNFWNHTTCLHRITCHQLRLMLPFIHKLYTFPTILPTGQELNLTMMKRLRYLCPLHEKLSRNYMSTALFHHIGSTCSETLCCLELDITRIETIPALVTLNITTLIIRSSTQKRIDGRIQQIEYPLSLRSLAIIGRLRYPHAVLQNKNMDMLKQLKILNTDLQPNCTAEITWLNRLLSKNLTDLLLMHCTEPTIRLITHPNRKKVLHVIYGVRGNLVDFVY